jgi:hypothetical protein
MTPSDTASANGGLCGQCVAVSEFIRSASHEFDQANPSGLAFQPTEAELESARTQIGFETLTNIWKLEPNYYQGSDLRSVQDVLAFALKQREGNVFLVSESGARLNLSFNEEYGVCEYQNEESVEYRYAFTANNLCEQVGENLHLAQACPCCGVGMLWYPTRFHMAREIAFAIFSYFALGEPTLRNVEWLEYGDISHTSKGRG